MPALLAWVTFLIYLIARNRGKPAALWFDEKQTEYLVNGCVLAGFTSRRG